MTDRNVIVDACIREEVVGHEAVLKPVEQLIPLASLEQQAAFFKTLGDLNRVKIMQVLTNYDHLCVYDISELIGASIATTSHHLITLKKSGIISSSKKGKKVYYTLESRLVSSFIELATRLKAKCPICGQIHD